MTNFGIHGLHYTGKILAIQSKGKAAVSIYRHPKSIRPNSLPDDIVKAVGLPLIVSDGLVFGLSKIITDEELISLDIEPKITTNQMLLFSDYTFPHGWLISDDISKKKSNMEEILASTKRMLKAKNRGKQPVINERFIIVRI